jgi:hypothetical protein
MSYYFAWFEYFVHWAAIYVLVVVPVTNVMMNVIKSNKEEEPFHVESIL